MQVKPMVFLPVWHLMKPFGSNLQVSGVSNDSSGNNVSHDTTLKVVIETITTVPTN